MGILKAGCQELSDKIDPVVQHLQQQDSVFAARSNAVFTNKDLIPGPLRGSHKIVIEGRLENHTRSAKSSYIEHLTRVSTRSSQKDLFKIMQGLLKGFQQDLQDLLTRTSKNEHCVPVKVDLHKNLQEPLSVDMLFGEFKTRRTGFDLDMMFNFQ